MDKIHIHGLKVETTIGCYAWERETRQNLLLDFELFYDIQAAGQQDDLCLTLDYATISQKVTDFLADSDFKLIEAVAEHTLNYLFTHFEISRAKIKVTKPRVLKNLTAVAVEIEREV